MATVNVSQLETDARKEFTDAIAGAEDQLGRAQRAINEAAAEVRAGEKRGQARFFLATTINQLIDREGTLATLVVKDRPGSLKPTPEAEENRGIRELLYDLAVAAGYDEKRWAKNLGIDMDTGTAVALASGDGAKRLGELRDVLDAEYEPPVAPDRTARAGGSQPGEPPVAPVEIDAALVADLRAAEDTLAIAQDSFEEFDADPLVWLVDQGRVAGEEVSREDRERVKEAEARADTPDAGTDAGTNANAFFGDTTSDKTDRGLVDSDELLSERLDAIASAVEEHGQEAVDDFFAMLEIQQGTPWGTVEALQEALAAAGFNPGPIDGIMGPLTRAAMEAFNVSIGGSGSAISADGWATLLSTSAGDGTPDTDDADTNANAFFGDTTTPDGTGTPDGGTPVDGPWGTVEALQEALLAAGFNPGPIDGIIGPLTRAAMEAFNVSIGGSGWGISADGWATLLSTSAGEGTPDEIVTDEDIANLAAAYGYGARWLNHEELGPILRQAAEEGWYDNETGIARLEAAIKATDWWDDFDANERNHQLLEASDPAEAERLLDLQVDMLQRAATRLGLTIADDRVREMARAAHVENWSDYQINQNMLLEAEWAPGQAGGAVEDNYAIIDALAGDYFVDHLIDDTTKDEWARALYLGDATEMGIRNDISALAQSSFPSMEARISQGYSTRQIVAPLRQEAARLLEIDATSIDFMTDPRFQPIWQQQNDDGTTRVMSVAETGQYVRGLEDWQTTTNATNDAYRFADYIGKKFGKAA